MKLLIITSIKECQDKVASIFKETGIEVFSVSEIAGFKEGSSVSLTHSWFGSGGDSYNFGSSLSFSPVGRFLLMLPFNAYPFRTNFFWQNNGPIIVIRY